MAKKITDTSYIVDTDYIVKLSGSNVGQPVVLKPLHLVSTAFGIPTINANLLLKQPLDSYTRVGTYTVNTSSYTVLDDITMVFCSWTDTGSIDIVLPSAATNTGRLIYVVDTGNLSLTNNITITATTGSVLFGTASVIATNGGSVPFVSITTGWKIF